MIDIREYLKSSPLLFDGGMGTYAAEKFPETDCEELNISHPEFVAAIHEEYISAGAMAIKTNTFSANRSVMGDRFEDIIRAGWAVADRYGDRAYIFADIGPISLTDDGDLAGAYTEVAQVFLKLGAKHFLFETNNSLEGLGEVCRYIKSKREDTFIILSFASSADGYTRSGLPVEALLQQAANLPIDAVGLNCGLGGKHMAELLASLELPRLIISALPNGGYPTVRGNRTYFGGSPEYFARQLSQMAANGVRILGGCCGTTPKHINAASKMLTEGREATVSKSAKRIAPVEKPSRLWEELCDPTKKPIAIELDPPENCDLTRFLEGADYLKGKGIAAITIADCPIGRPRMDSSLLACKLRRELDLEILPHMTCRDRNLNATKALLLGLCAENVHNVLVVTGDPIPSADRDEVKSVYNFNSRMLAGYIDDLNSKLFPTPFKIFGALNLNARNFDIQLGLARQKEQKGVCGFLTQPILSERAIKNLKKARSVLKGKILGGIFPIVSYKNACFMDSEVAGVSLDKRLIDAYKDLDRAEGEALAERISFEIAEAISPYVDGYYLMTPFARYELMGRIVEKLK